MNIPSCLVDSSEASGQRLKVLVDTSPRERERERERVEHLPLRAGLLAGHLSDVLATHAHGVEVRRVTWSGQMLDFFTSGELLQAELLQLCVQDHWVPFANRNV